MKKYYALFSILIILHLTASVSYAQYPDDKLVSLTANNEPLSVCLEKITATTGITFLFGDALIDDIRVNCSIRNSFAEDILKILLPAHGLDFRRTDKKQIVIFRKTPRPLYNVEGTVKNKRSGERLPYTNVILAGTGTGTIANTEGHFVISNIRHRKFLLSFSRIGCVSRTIEVDLDSLQKLNPGTHTPELNIELEDRDIIFSPLVINAGYDEIFRASEFSSRFSMSPRNQLALPVIGDADISRSLQLIAGIGTSNFGSSGLNIRGGIPSQNLVLLDGITLYHMNHSFGFFNAFNPDAVKDIQVYKGAYPAKFGGRLSGVVELNTSNGDMQRPHIALGINQMNGKVLAEIPLFGLGSLLFSARRSLSDFVLGNLYNRIFNSFRQNITLYESQMQRSSQMDHEISFNDILGKLTLLPERRSVITITYFSGLDKLSSDGNQMKLPLRMEENSTTQNYGGSIRWYRTWSPWFSSSVMFSHSDYSADSKKSWKALQIIDTLVINEINTINELQENSFSADNRYDIHPDHSLEFGLKYTRHSILYDFYIENIFLDRVIPASTHIKNTVEQFSYYAQDTWKISSRFTAVGGLRLNKYQLYGNIHAEPRISLSYGLADNIVLKCAWGRFYQYIMQYEDFTNILQGKMSWISADGGKIKPSDADHYVFGAKFENPEYLLDAEAYLKKNRSVPQAPQDWQLAEKNYPDLPVEQNSSESRGLDIIFRRKAGILQGWISYGYCQSTTKYRHNDVWQESPSSNDTPHKIDIAASLRLGNFTVSAAWHWLSGRPYSVPKLQESKIDEVTWTSFSDPDKYNDHRFPASHQLDLSAAYALNAGRFNVLAGVSFFNLYDRQNVWYRFANIKNSRLVLTDVYMLGFTPTFFCDMRF